MAYIVNYKEVETIGLESSPVVTALAGLRANEARYFGTKHKYEFATEKAEDRQDLVEYINKVLSERDIKFSVKPLEVTQFVLDGIRWTFVFYEDGLAINVMYTIEEGGKRAVGFKLSEGMEIPKELEGKFKFARRKSKLAGEIRGSFFVIKGVY